MPASDPTLRLDDLSEPLRVHSRVLGEDLWIVPDGYAAALDGVTYSVSECRILAELRPGADELDVIHRTKARLDAALVRDTDRSGVQQSYHAALARYRELERQCDQSEQGSTPEAEAELLALAKTLSTLSRKLDTQ